MQCPGLPGGNEWEPPRWMAPLPGGAYPRAFHALRTSEEDPGTMGQIQELGRANRGLGQQAKREAEDLSWTWIGKVLRGREALGPVDLRTNVVVFW